MLRKENARRHVYHKRGGMRTTLGDNLHSSRVNAMRVVPNVKTCVKSSSVKTLRELPMPGSKYLVSPM